MISEITVKSILNKKKKRDDWFLDEYTINAYQGCSMNCLYCYVRGSRYGINMADKLSVKMNAVEVLEKQLQYRVKKNQFGFVVLSSATDPYMLIDEKYKMTENFLHLLERYKFPVHIITKSNRVLNNIPVLKEIDKNAILPDDLKLKLNKGVIISVSISTLNSAITNMLEPAADNPYKRLETIKNLKEEGFLAGVNLMPILPFISDSEKDLDEMICAAKRNGADYVLAGGLTLFGTGVADSKTLYYKFLSAHYPALIPAYDKLYNGSDFPPRFYIENINTMVNGLCKKYNIRNRIIN